MLFLIEHFVNKVRNTISTIYVSLTAVIFYFHGLILEQIFYIIWTYVIIRTHNHAGDSFSVAQYIWFKFGKYCNVSRLLLGLQH